MFIDTTATAASRAPDGRNVFQRRVAFRFSGAREVSGTHSQVARWRPIAQCLVILITALIIKLYYSTASPNQLRWILAPTTVLVELISETGFNFESHAGYLSSDRSFLIAASCAGVNFLITSFLMLSLRKLWRFRSQPVAWRFIPVAALFAYLATLVANTVRISTALGLKRMDFEVSWLSGNQLHRFEGIFIYFGFLLLLFLLSERFTYITEGRLVFAAGQHARCPGSGCLRPTTSGNRFGWLRQFLFPLVIYYATVLGIPLVNTAYGGGISAATGLWEHSLFVLLIPLLVILPIAMFRVYLATFRSLRNPRNLRV